MMECNKAEAIMAKDAAEKKMQDNDFEGARRIVLKAQQLFPELENINQLLTVCNVHLAAQNKILGSGKDLYGILQLDKLADEVVIKKQYRKLALTLHPDKNKLPGAEAAFKLVGEASVLLLDPIKKAVYDSQCKVVVRTANAQPPPYQYNSLNRRQTTTKPTVIQETFWTACHHCKTKFQYLKIYVNRVVDCQSCKQKFTTYEISVQFYATSVGKPQSKPMPPGKAASQNVPDSKNRTQGVSASQPHSQGVPSTASRASVYQTPVFPPKDGPRPSRFSMDPGNTAATHTGLQGCDNTKTANSDFGMTGSASIHGEKVETENKVGANLNSVAGGNFEGVPVQKNERKSGTGNNGRKRERKRVVESSERKVKNENKYGSHLNSVAGGNHEGMSARKKERESGTGINGRKRGRKHVVESSESSDTSSSMDTMESSENSDISSSNDEMESSECSDTSSSKDTGEDAFEEDCAHPNTGVDGAPSSRRSSRHRQSVLYHENGNDEDDFESRSKRPSKNKSSGNNLVKEAVASKNDAEHSSTAINTRANDKSEENGYSKKTFSDETSQMEKLTKTTSTMGHVPDVVEILDDFESDPEDTAEATVYYCPDPEFTDFDKEKEEICFAVDQIWALYDTIDGMPRFYAQIKKIFKPGFKVLIIWLEGDPQDDHEISWLSEDLPFGCGRFELGDSKITSDRLSFSHQVHFEKDKNGTSVFIRPMKGEIWALFKDWNRDWNLDPLKHQKYKFEIVEVISDFSEDAGIIVSYLDKVRGFVCLFQRASASESDFLLIRPDQMLRFSHSIPSCKMSGTEREGVPVGCFELDTASLPQDPNDICYPLKVTSAKEILQNGTNQLDKKSENVALPGKYVDAEAKNVVGLNADFLRLSPRGIKMNSSSEKVSSRVGNFDHF